MTIDTTHDPHLRSWVPGAEDPQTDFPIQNLPFGRFRRAGTGETWRIGVAIGTQVLDLREARHAVRWGAAISSLLETLGEGDLNRFMAAGVDARRDLRAALSNALCEGCSQQEAVAACLLPQADAELTLPCRIGDYTDFFTGIHHATAVGRLLRPDNPLLPNYKWVPIGYHGRTSSIVPSGTPVVRPSGQTMEAGLDKPRFGPSVRLDYELELGYLIGQGNAQGEPVDIARAEDHLFGVTLLNDWSARDLQAWEYQPLGPFLAKNFASTISPWVVTMDALAPFRAPLTRSDTDPRPLPYLDSEGVWKTGALDIQLEVWIHTSAMRDQGLTPARISRSEARQAAFWTPAQLVAHHTVNGCNLQAGDLFGSGTLSGTRPNEAGSLIELTAGGREPLRLSNGQARTFLEDGDTIILKAGCQREGVRRIGFGSCTGTIVTARAR